MGNSKCPTVKQLESSGFIHDPVSLSSRQILHYLIDRLLRTIAPRPSHALQVRFEIQSHTFSSLKVEHLKVTGELYKPYKGVRGRSVGNVEWRW